MSARRLPLIVNRGAGGPGDPRDAIIGALAAVGIEADVRSDDARFGDALAAVIESGAPVVGVAGGDGTVRKAVRALAGHDTALAVFPTGTLNHFARSIGLDSIETTAAAVAGGRVERIGVSYADDEPFLNTATFGLYADVVRRRDRLKRWIGKWPAALVAFNVAIVRYRPLRITIEVDGRALERPTALVGVGMNRRSFPVRDVPMRLNQEPELIVSIMRAPTRSGLLGTGSRTMLRLLRGEIGDDSRDIELLRTDAFSLATRSHRLGVTLDGDIADLGTAVRVTTRRDALRVVVPASFSD